MCPLIYTHREFDLDVPDAVDILHGVLVPSGGLEQVISVQRNHKSKVCHIAGVFFKITMLCSSYLHLETKLVG